MWNHEMSAKVRVARGAVLLDCKGPDGWRAMINRETLDMWKPCVLDMVMGGYTAGLMALGLDTGSEYGFTPSPGIHAVRVDDDAEELRAEWIAESQRQPAGAR